MFRWNRCPRCKGDVLVDRDEYGWYEECLMCGYTHDLGTAAVTQRRQPEHDAEEKRKVKHAG